MLLNIEQLLVRVNLVNDAESRAPLFNDYYGNFVKDRPNLTPEQIKEKDTQLVEIFHQTHNLTEFDRTQLEGLYNSNKELKQKVDAIDKNEQEAQEKADKLKEKEDKEAADSAAQQNQEKEAADAKIAERRTRIKNLSPEDQASIIQNASRRNKTMEGAAERNIKIAKEWVDWLAGQGYRQLDEKTLGEFGILQLINAQISKKNEIKTENHILKKIDGNLYNIESI